MYDRIKPLFDSIDQPLSILGFLYILIIFLSFFVTACQSQAALGSTSNLPTIDQVGVETAIPPPVVVTIAAPQNNQSFRPMDAGELAATTTVIASSTTNLDLMEEFTPESTAILSNEPTTTPMPTFTPPALPQTSPWEHYWLRRPVPEESAVWTDKAYPYGSNRGGTLRTHHGVEFNVPNGTEVMAAASGTIIVAGDDRLDQIGPINNFYGNVIVIEHDTTFEDKPVYSLYGHLSDILVNVGQHVQAQDIIAQSGASGVADGPHLHFEVRAGENDYGATRNPLLWLYPFPDRGVVAGRITDVQGQILSGVPINLRRIDAPSAYAGTTTYADDSVNPDDRWQENFVFDDVVAGYYELSVGRGEDKLAIEFWVYPYQTTFVEMMLKANAGSLTKE